MNERLPVMTSTRILLDVSVLLKKKMLKKRYNAQQTSKLN